MDQAARPTDRRNHIGALDSLRGLMSWWVVAGHLGAALAFHNLFNDLPVDVFIILSGYVIFRLLDLKREAWRPFIVRRGFRLFPAYLFALLVSVVLLQITRDVFSWMPFHGAVNRNRTLIADEGLTNLLPHLLVHLTLLQGLVPNWLLAKSPVTLIGQAWSVSLEWQFYLLAPAAFYAVERRRLWIPLVGSVLILMLATKVTTSAFVGAKVLLFGVGLGSYLLVRAVEFGRSKTGPAFVFFACAVAALAKEGLSVTIPLVMWTAVLMATMSPPGTLLRKLNNVLNTKALLRLGTISYSTYLIHMAALVVVAAVLNVFAMSREAYAALLIIGTVALTYAASELMYNFIEKPLKR